MSMNRAPESGYVMFGPEPPIPDVPHAEWKARVDRARGLMLDAGIDLLLLASERNCRYFASFTMGHWLAASIHPLVLLLPVEGEPVALCADLFRFSVEAQSWVRDIRGQADAHEIRAQRSFWVDVAETVKDMGFGSATIGLEMGQLGHMYIPRPLNDIRAMMDGLPNARFVDGDQVIWGCRMRKSPLEIERIRNAAAIHRTATADVVAQYRPGMTERDIGKIYQMSCIQNNADWVQSSHIACGASKEGMFDLLAYFDGMTIGSDDYLWMDIVVAYKGYWADFGRVFNVGSPTKWFADANETLWKAFDAGLGVAKPGARGADLYEAITAVEREAGFQPLETVGHGIGLDIHEPPVLSRDCDLILEPGMTFAVEPALMGGWRKTGGGGIVHYEDIIVVTERGCEIIAGLPRGITQVAHPFV